MNLNNDIFDDSEDEDVEEYGIDELDALDEDGEYDDTLYDDEEEFDMYDDEFEDDDL